MTIQAVIFDLDGTITHTLPLCIRAFREAIEPLAGRSVTDEEIIATFGPSEEGTIMALVPDHYEEGVAEYLAAYERHIGPDHGPFSGVTNWLSSLLDQGKKLALVTGKGPGSTEMTLLRYGLTDYFEHIATGSPTGSVKAECISDIVAKWGLRPEQVAYVGDAPSDIIAAQSVGVRMISVTWATEGASIAEQLHAFRPDVVVNSIAEAEAWLAAQHQ